MNALLKSFDIPHHNESTFRLSADLSLHEARKRSLQRTVQALFRENLLRRT